MKKKQLKKLFKKLLKLGFASALAMVVAAVAAVGFAVFRSRQRRRFTGHDDRGYDYRRFDRPRSWSSRAYR